MSQPSVPMEVALQYRPRVPNEPNLGSGSQNVGASIVYSKSLGVGAFIEASGTMFSPLFPKETLDAESNFSFKSFPTRLNGGIINQQAFCVHAPLRPKHLHVSRIFFLKAWKKNMKYKIANLSK